MIKRNTHNKNGFSLMEVLLATVILSGLFFVIIGILRSYTEQTIAQSASNYVEQISQSIEDILRNSENFESIYSDADAQINDILEITIDNIITGNIGSVTVPPTSSLNSNFSDQTPFKTGVDIMIRASNDNMLEIVIATDSLAPDHRVRMAAERSKLYGGFYRDVTNGIVSAYNSWRLNPSVDLVGTNWWDNVASVTPPSIGDQSYFIHYKHMIFDDVVGDYLYRTRVPDRAELNQIYADLNMGGQNILGVDNMNALGDVSVQSRVNVNDTMAVAGDTILNQGNFRAYGTLSTQDATILGLGSDDSTGFLQVQDLLETDLLNINGDVSAINATFNSNLTINANLTANSIQGAQRVTSQGIFIQDLNSSSPIPIDLMVDGQLNTGDIVTSSFQFDGPNDMGVIDMTANQQATVGGSLNTPNAVIENLRPNTFGACDIGC